MRAVARLASGCDVTKAEGLKEHAAETPPARRQAARSASVWVGAIGVLGASALGALIMLSHSHQGPAAPTTPPPVVKSAALPGLETEPPPWPGEKGHLRERLGVLGLPALTRAGTTLHTHEHLDVFVDGRPVTVPTGIGIADDFISPIHTHDASGVIHVESPTRRNFSLAEFFGVWGVRLTRKCLGGECGAAKLHVFVNGRPVRDPNLALLTPHGEIVVAFGPPPKPLPSSYSFPAGT
jgi:hypothetical protein